MTDIPPPVARLWEKGRDKRVNCRLCSHFCSIENGERGLCGVRENQGGQLRTLAYDRVAAANLDPVEKKPLYHFLPGTRTFSFGTQGCNMVCSFCQNASLSQSPKGGRTVAGQRATPEMLVRAALDSGAKSISYTYSEPTVFFELMADTAELALENGLKNIMVSNGFQSPQCLDKLEGLIQAANIDCKAFTEDFYRERCGARLKPVLENLKHIKRMGWWLEVTTLVIPGLNDSEEELAGIAGFIAGELDADTPWHLSRFHPQYRLTDRPSTPLETLMRGRKAGSDAGLKYVYVGNVPGNEGQHSACPGCGVRLAERNGFVTGGWAVEDGKCAQCGEPIAGVWEA